MSNWRPDGWENNKKIVLYGGGRQTGRAEYSISKASFEAGADAMLEAISNEIEKVEKANPYSKAKLASAEYYEGEGFHRACQKILALLK